MKDQFSEFIEFLKTPFPHFFIILSFAITAFLFTDSNFIKTIYDKEKAIEVAEIKNENKVFVEDGESHFTVTCVGSNELDLLEDLVKSFSILLSTPAVITSLISVEALRIDYPHWSPDTFELFATIAFVYFNINFFLLLSYSLKLLQETRLENKPPPKPILSILPK